MKCKKLNAILNRVPHSDSDMLNILRNYFCVKQYMTDIQCQCSVNTVDVSLTNRQQ